MFGLKEYYEGLLLEAKSPEEIKKILEYQFVQGKGIPQEILDSIFAMDPTKKKSYTRWVLSQWENFRVDIIPSITNGMLQKLFEYFKERAADGLDFGKYNFKQALDMIPVGVENDPVLKKMGDLDAPVNDFDIVYRSPEWVIAVPHTYEADKKLGQGCKWCTAGAYNDGDESRGEHFYEQYSSNGNLWVNFDLRKSQMGIDRKEYPYTRYQFCFEDSPAGELKDIRNYNIVLNEIDMPQSVLDFYGTQNSKYVKQLEATNGDEEHDPYDDYEIDTFEEDYRAARLENRIEVLNEGGETLILLPDYDRNYDFFREEHYLDADACVYSLYNESDTRDSIFPFEFSANCNLVRRENGNIKYSMLTDIAGNRYFIISDYDNEFLAYQITSDEMIIDTDGATYAVGKYSGRRSSSAVITTVDGTYEAGEITITNRPFTDITAFFENDNIASVVSHTNASVQTFLEVVFNDGGHWLYSTNGNGDPTLLIKNDLPINGKCYEIELSETRDFGIIRGEKMQYKINLGDFAPDKYGAEEDLGGQKYLVSNKDGKYNIYDAIEGKLMLATWVTDIITVGKGVAIVKYSWNQSVLYNFEFGYKISDAYENIDNLFNHTRYFLALIDSADYSYCLLKMENEMKVSVFKIGHVKYKTRTGYIATTDMVYYYEKPMFSNKLDYISQPTGNVFLCKTNNKIYFINTQLETPRLLPSNDGIMAQYIVSVFPYGGHTIQILIALPESENQRAVVLYNISNNVVTSINGGLNDEELSTINKIFFPSRTALTEGFYKILNKITPKYEDDI